MTLLQGSLPPSTLMVNPPLSREVRSRLLGIAAISALLLLGACTAPGMKLDVRPGQRETTTQMDGMNVTLRALNADAVVAQKPRASDPASLDALVQEKAHPYRIGPQDVLLVTVWDHPEISLPLGQYRQDASSGTVVDEAGEIYFPHVGSLKVAGLTTSQAREAQRRIGIEPGAVVQFRRGAKVREGAGGEVQRGGHTVTGRSRRAGSECEEHQGEPDASHLCRLDRAILRNLSYERVTGG